MLEDSCHRRSFGYNKHQELGNCRRARCCLKRYNVREDVVERYFVNNTWILDLQNPEQSWVNTSLLGNQYTERATPRKHYLQFDNISLDFHNPSYHRSNRWFHFHATKSEECIPEIYDLPWNRNKYPGSSEMGCDRGEDEFRSRAARYNVHDQRTDETNYTSVLSSRGAYFELNETAEKVRSAKFLTGPPL